VLRIKGRGERSLYSDYKAAYSYLDARRWAKPRGLIIRGPQKIYDSTPALIGGLFAETQGRLLEYSRKVYALFFKRELEIDRPDAIASVVESLGMSADGYRAYLAGPGVRAFEAAQEEAARDHIFGVPIFVFQGEPFWGHDRLPALEERLREGGLFVPA
jgi:2-hydroxychromene-2-carboxylate isomerase